jgi:glucose-6-phosphate 1-epimerase
MATEAEQLNAAFGKPGAVSFFAHPLGGVAAALVTPQASAEVALHGAHVLSFKPGDAAEVLWMSPQACIAEGKGIRGGIPVCWPWFAQHPDDPAKPDHGFVRKGPWRVTATSASDDGAVSITLTTATDAASRAIWPFDAEVSVTVTLSDALRVDLVTRNTGSVSFPLTQALHTYFAVGNVADISVRGLASRTYLDKLQDYARLEQHGDITFAGEVDRIYEDTPDTVVILDNGNARAIRVAKEGSASTVVWNPWVEKSARLSDMPPGTYLGMVCVETTNAGGDVITVQPGDTHRLAAILSTEPLSPSAT